MNKTEIYNLLKDNICVQDEALRKLIWILDNNLKYPKFKQNILLIGERGSGKTTMLKKIADLMEIKVSEIYNLFRSLEINNEMLMSGLTPLMTDDNINGILLLHDFQDLFLLGDNFKFNSMVASNVFDLGSCGCYDVSNVIFIGEIDINGVENIFPENIDNLTDFENGIFDNPMLKIIQKSIKITSPFYINADGNRVYNLYFEKHLSDLYRQQFLSSNCSNAFPEKIYMDVMDTKQILNALKSPISLLNLFKDDLDEDYIKSDKFMNDVAYQIIESGEGLHFVSQAVKNTIAKDYRKNEKVLKKGSLLIPSKR